MAHFFDPSAWESGIEGQPGLHRNILFQKQKQTRSVIPDTGTIEAKKL